MAQIAKMRISHELILDWLLLNPDKTQNECAAYFDVTPAWLSTVVNSDCFKARLATRRLALDHKVGDLTIGKIQGVVDKGLERLDEMIPLVQDPAFILNTTDKLLHRLGYGPRPGVGVQFNTQVNNTFTVNRTVLAEARAGIHAAGAALANPEGPPPVAVLEAPAPSFPPHAPQAPDLPDPAGALLDEATFVPPVLSPDVIEAEAFQTTAVRSAISLLADGVPAEVLERKAEFNPRCQ